MGLLTRLVICLFTPFRLFTLQLFLYGTYNNLLYHAYTIFKVEIRSLPIFKGC